MPKVRTMAVVLDCKIVKERCNTSAFHHLQNISRNHPNIEYFVTDYW
jgi:hypothetical protein